MAKKQDEVASPVSSPNVECTCEGGHGSPASSVRRRGDAKGMRNTSSLDQLDLDVDDDSKKRTCKRHFKISGLVHYERLPHFLKDNPFITGGYRVGMGWRKSCKSLCSMHNETINIWTHFIGFVLLVILASMTLWSNEYAMFISGHEALQTTVLRPLPEADAMDDHIGWLNTLDMSSQASAGSLASHASAQPLAAEGAAPANTANTTQNSHETWLTKLFHSFVSEKLSTHVNEEFRKISSTTQGMVEKVKTAMSTALVPYVQNFSAILSNDSSAYQGPPVAHPPWAEGEHNDQWSLLVPLPKWPMVLFLISAACCLGCSTIFHWFSAVSQEVYGHLQALDYAGISLLIGGSNVPVVYYGFYCHPWIRLSYLIWLVVMSVSGFFITLAPCLRHRRFRSARTGIFVIMGLTGIVPIAHLFSYMPYEDWIYALGNLIAMGIMYLGGALIYVTQVPERFAPGMFDVYCASHQWWHALILFAVLVHYSAVLWFYQWRGEQGCFVAW